jgi:hypothetical protein
LKDVVFISIIWTMRVPAMDLYLISASAKSLGQVIEARTLAQVHTWQVILEDQGV